MDEQNGGLTFTLDLAKIRENKLFVAIPMYGGQTYEKLVRSMMELTSLCERHGIPLRTYFLSNESLVQRARNYCTEMFLQSDANHFMFIDSDIGFKAQDVLLMAHLQNVKDDFDIVCGPYPKKVIAWEKVKAAVDRGMADANPGALQNFVGDYVFNAIEAGTYSIHEPLEVMESGTGFMMIKRSTFDRFREAYPENQYRPDHIRHDVFDGSKMIHAYFDCVIDNGPVEGLNRQMRQAIKERDWKTVEEVYQQIVTVEHAASKRYLSEDYYFCQKARQAGMHVWLLPWIELTHTGTFEFGGSIAALASIQQSPTVDDDTKKKKVK